VIEVKRTRVIHFLKCASVPRQRNTYRLDGICINRVSTTSGPSRQDCAFVRRRELNLELTFVEQVVELGSASRTGTAPEMFGRHQVQLINLIAQVWRKVAKHDASIS